MYRNFPFEEVSCHEGEGADWPLVEMAEMVLGQWEDVLQRVQQDLKLLASSPSERWATETQNKG